MSLEMNTLLNEVVNQTEQIPQEVITPPPTPVITTTATPRSKPDKTIITRLCSCGECRFHSTSEPGWTTCPNNPIRGQKNVVALWGINPEWLKSVSETEIIQEMAVQDISANIMPISPEDK